jgi:hypothetical protein
MRNLFICTQRFIMRFLYFLAFLIISCSYDDTISENNNEPKNYKYLVLGDWVF